MKNFAMIFGLLDNSADFPNAKASARARDLTIAWSRYKYFGEIIEHRDLDEILRRAAATSADFCLVQSYGHILAEVWRADNAEAPEIMQAIEEWIGQQEFLLTGRLHKDEQSGITAEVSFLLINLRRYRELSCPGLAFSQKISTDSAGHLNEQGIEKRHSSPAPVAGKIKLNSTWSEAAIFDIPSSIDASLVRLDPGNPESWKQQLCTGSEMVATAATTSQEAFLSNIGNLTKQLKNGIFVWNLESYEDVERPSDNFRALISTLYSVSAGFKPNRILETHGFTSATRMVVFDYSPKGLEFRRMLHEDWDGVDYPSFLRRLFRKIPSGDAFYLLWDGMTPDNLDWSLVDRRWQQELDAWGGEEALARHWQAFRRMKVEYLCCDILTEQDHLLEKVRDEENALIWWSNAFFSVYSNWLYSTAQRQAFYFQWIEQLASKAPGLFLFGSDCHNISVNFCNAGEYFDWLRTQYKTGFDELNPPRLQRYELRF